MKPFIFIHINKTGGTSLWHLLGQTPSHRTAADLKTQFHPDEWESFPRFTLVRNPYDRAVSLYNYRRSRNAQNILEDDLSFVEFLERALVLKTAPYYNRAIMLSAQYDWLTDIDGNLAVSHIFSFENYRDSVGQILKLIDHPDPFGVRLPHVKKTSHQPWQAFYEGPEGLRAKEIIQTEWAKDFYYLNYSTEIPNGLH